MKVYKHWHNTQPKNVTKSHEFWKTPQKLFKNQNLGQKRMECMIKEWERIIPDEEHLIWVEDQERNVKGLSLRCLRVREERICQERLKEMSEKSRGTYL